ncbi:hypothetical protein IMSAG049_01081 [Clostridiales bacterium]|nr:hypothetical protein IMSAG049_01081 [Clostridiales bacterium]
MSDNFDNENFDEEMEIITMIDDDTDEEVDFAVIDRKEFNGTEYILVIESEAADDDEVEAIILKAIGESDEEITYSLVEDEDEFQAVASIFDSDEYDVEY